MNQPPPMPPTFLEKLAKKLDELKEINHEFVLISSGTMNQVNKDILSKVPMKDRNEANRKLMYDWSQGNQSLQGLRAIVKDTTLIYKEGHLESIKRAMKSEIQYGDNTVIVPDQFREQIKEYAPALTVIPRSTCLIFD